MLKQDLLSLGAVLAIAIAAGVFILTLYCCGITFLIYFSDLDVIFN